MSMSRFSRGVTAVAVTIGLSAVVAAPAIAGPSVMYPTLPTSASISIATGANVKVISVAKKEGYVNVPGGRRMYAAKEALYGLRNTVEGRSAASVVRSSPVVINRFLAETNHVIGTVEPEKVLSQSATQKVVAGAARLPGAASQGTPFWGVEDTRRIGNGRVLVAGACYRPGETLPSDEEIADLAACAARVAIAATNAQS